MCMILFAKLGGAIPRASSTDQALHLFAVPCSCYADLGDGVPNLAQIIRCETEGYRTDILLESILLGRSRNRNDPGFLGQEPRERKLCRRRMLARGDCGEHIDQSHLGLARFRGKARYVVA